VPLNSALGVAAVIGLALIMIFNRTPANERRKMPNARHIVSVGFHHPVNGEKAAMEGNGA